VQQKFDEAVAAYKRILARDDVPDYVRASANNNLAFLLAMMKQNLDEALAGANEAIEILGPNSDILDTRALVYLHKGEFDKAVEDLQMAVKAGATASKYFHLAEALLAAGDAQGALEAWHEAEARGISMETTPVVEQEDLEQFMLKIKALEAPAQASAR
jgi:tetratricopeptide (TPR) repeat protein